MVILRLLHIGSGVIWAGSTFFFFFLLEPATRALGPQAGPVMEFLVSKRKMPIVFAIASTVTVLSGAVVYWRVSNGFDRAWLESGWEWA